MSKQSISRKQLYQLLRDLRLPITRADGYYAVGYNGALADVMNYVRRGEIEPKRRTP